MSHRRPRPRWAGRYRGRAPLLGGLALAAAAIAPGCADSANSPEGAASTYSAPASDVANLGEEPNVTAPPTSKVALAELDADYTPSVVATGKSAAMVLMSSIDPTICLDVPYGKTFPGAVPHAYTCLGPAQGQQTWIFDNGQLIIGGGCCLALGGGQSIGAQPTLSPCLADRAAARRGSQLWTYDHGSLSLVGSSLCLGLGRDTAIANSPLRLDPCAADNALQQWALANSAASVAGKAPPLGLVAYLRRSSTFCMDVFSGLTADGTSVGVYNCNDLPPQRLVVQGTQVRYQKKCIGVAGRAATAGATLELQACSGTEATQAFVVEDGTLRLASSSPSLCMCVPSGAPQLDKAMPLQLLACEVNAAANPDCLWSFGKR